jgi:hypothetical protein
MKLLWTSEFNTLWEVGSQETASEPSTSVIVLDSAPFHCLLIALLPYEGKAYMVSWLCKECVVCDESMSKHYLSVNFFTEAQEVIYKSDHIMANHGHTGVWLPPCMCDPSHIVLVWSKIKRLGHEHNIIIDMNLLKLQVTNASFSLVTKDDWQEFCIHIENVDKQDWQANV